MLQIATGMYFPDGEVWETTHRRTFYSNAIRMRANDIELPIGTLRFSNGSGTVQPVMIEVIDRLPKKNPDGSPSNHIATGGNELVEDAADVAAFAFDAVFAADPDLADRLIAGRTQGGRANAKPLQKVTEGGRYISDDEITGAGEFCSDLLALNRTAFEAAMRAIRRVADAVSLSASDMTLSYTLFVAALESLSGDTTVAPLEWQQYDKHKRQLVDHALEDVLESRANGVREAVLAIDSMRVARKFQTFVIDHVTEAFFRDEAVNAERAIRSVDLPNALTFAYRIRSKAMHELRDLAPELWVFAGGEETSWHSGQTVFTLEGLHRLSQHVIRQYVKRASSEIDEDFKSRWRSAIPGIVTVELAPQYWLGNEPKDDQDAGRRMFGALAEQYVSFLHRETDTVVDLSAGLERIESRLPDERRRETRRQLAATYELWHRMTDRELHSSNYETTAASYMSLLAAPSIYTYVIALAGGSTSDFPDEAVFALADARRQELSRSRKSLLRLPRDIDGVLAVDAAMRAQRSDSEDAHSRLVAATELLPGDRRVLDLVTRIQSGERPEVDPRAFIAATPD